MRRIAIVAALLLFRSSSYAQWFDVRTSEIPRTADGKPILAAPVPRTPTGKPDLSGLWRRKQARAILSELDHQPERLPTLLAGDLNEWRSGGCLRDFGQHHECVALGASFPARRTIGRLAKDNSRLYWVTSARKSNSRRPAAHGWR